MAVRVALCRALSGCRGASLRSWSKIPAQRLQPRRKQQLLYTTEATQRLLKAVDTELSLEKRTLDKLPEISGFETTVTGPIATLTRTHGDNTVKVEMDVNHSIEVTPEEILGSEGEEEETEEDDIEPMFVPAFTVMVTKPSGDSVQLECSFEEYGPYLERERAWESLRVDSVSVIQAGTQDAQSVYSADTRNLSESFYFELLEYLKEHGINEHFADNVLEYYKTFEHTCYCSNFLEEFQKFLTSK